MIPLTTPILSDHSVNKTAPTREYPTLRVLCGFRNRPGPNSSATITDPGHKVQKGRKARLG